ncbi:hypothetical protein COX86_03090 [Candidatus Micrarchaeota archaeon CG_4_10_14_0_2_um_filter_60_11]|nr:MAG: hypothetical protein COT58_02305 [Candidatus Micrarchaeota archaeon CG09_land_8_20_14_0_10_60_16]PIZ90785.1 MAG: hypothetical protein COX86_03090 [Candidatus Micrarchaeota archaeon CG_4_10_14_0_2_um_filter_60_11]
MTHARQKETSRARLTLDSEVLAKLDSGQFTLYDFLSMAFPFSEEKRRDAMRVLESVQKEPKSFKTLRDELGVPKSALFYLLLALSNAGLVEKEAGKSNAYRLSGVFSANLGKMARWWASRLD